MIILTGFYGPGNGVFRQVEGAFIQGQELEATFGIASPPDCIGMVSQ
jgi:hypothetical protein